MKDVAVPQEALQVAYAALETKVSSGAPDAELSECIGSLKAVCEQYAATVSCLKKFVKPKAAAKGRGKK